MIISLLTSYIKFILAKKVFFYIFENHNCGVPHTQLSDLFSSEHIKSKTKSTPTSAGLREERIVLAMEEIIQELAIRLNLTTLQVQTVFNF